MPNEFDESSYGYPNDGGSDINNTWQTEANRAGQPQQDQVYYTRPQPGTQNHRILLRVFRLIILRHIQCMVCRRRSRRGQEQKYLYGVYVQRWLLLLQAC